jgi:hypothetical protein
VIKPDTVESRLKEAEAELQNIKAFGVSAKVVIKIFECLIDVIRTLAIHTVQARTKNIN